jgi:hypothetical protein
MKVEYEGKSRKEAISFDNILMFQMFDKRKASAAMASLLIFKFFSFSPL